MLCTSFSNYKNVKNICCTSYNRFPSLPGDDIPAELPLTELSFSNLHNANFPATHTFTVNKFVSGTFLCHLNWLLMLMIKVKKFSL